MKLWDVHGRDHAEHQEPYCDGAPNHSSSTTVSQAEGIREQSALPGCLENSDEADNADL